MKKTKYNLSEQPRVLIDYGTPVVYWYPLFVSRKEITMKKKPINRKKEVEEKKSERFWREMMGTNKPRYVKRGGVIRQK